jgi:hypothetical protein
MKMRALGTAPARPAAAPQTPPAAPAVAPVLYAAILKRDRAGVVTELALPGPIYGSSIPLTARTACGGAIEVGIIGARGQVRAAPDLPPNFDAGTRLLAVTDSQGRVVAVHAMTPKQPLPAPGKVTRRSAASPAPARSGDPYAHDPHEVLIAGAAGRVLRVGGAPVGTVTRRPVRR